MHCVSALIGPGSMGLDALLASVAECDLGHRLGVAVRRTALGLFVHGSITLALLTGAVMCIIVFHHIIHKSGILHRLPKILLTYRFL